MHFNGKHPVTECDLVAESGSVWDELNNYSAEFGLKCNSGATADWQQRLMGIEVISAIQQTDKKIFLKNLKFSVTRDQSLGTQHFHSWRQADRLKP